MTVYEIGEWQQQPFIAMEYVEGETLEERLRRGSMSKAEAISAAEQIADALASAHNARIIHRDLKPANVMLRPNGSVKVLDFGLARLMEMSDEPSGNRTASGQAMGTPAYMAPEQWEGRAADARSDIYAFGRVLSELLTGQRAGTDRVALEDRALERIVARCLRPDPNDRWQTAADLTVELRRVQSGQRRWREIRIALGVAILVVGGFLIWQRPQARTLTDKDVVVLADFANTTGDPVFDGTLHQALALHLEQSPFLQILEDTVSRQDPWLMGRDPGERITGQTAQDICVREAAAATIAGSIAGLGMSYVITLHAVTCQNGATLARAQAQAEDKERVLQALGTAATAMRLTSENRWRRWRKRPAHSTNTQRLLWRPTGTTLWVMPNYPRAGP